MESKPKLFVTRMHRKIYHIPNSDGRTSLCGWVINPILFGRSKQATWLTEKDIEDMGLELCEKCRRIRDEQ